jgi:hypothetical protein
MFVGLGLYSKTKIEKVTIKILGLQLELDPAWIQEI